MGTTTNILLLSFAISLPAIAKSVEYQPINFTVNDNFNGQPDKTAHGMSLLEPNLINQGGNYYFYPQVQLPLGLLPPHISALLASIHHKNESIYKPEIELSPINNFKDDAIDIIKITELPEPVERVELMNHVLVPEPEIYFEGSDKGENLQPVETIHINKNVIDTLKLEEVPIPQLVKVVEEENFGKPLILTPLPVPDKHEDDIHFASPIIQDEVNKNPIAEQTTTAELPLPKPINVVKEENCDTSDDKHDAVIQEIIDSIEETHEIPIPETLVTSELPIPKPIDVIEKENCDRFPKHDENDAVIEEIEVIPEVPILPPLSINIPPSIFSNEIHETPILEPIVTAELPTPKPIDVVEAKRPLYDDHDAMIEEIVAMPEAPVLPSLSINIPTPIYIEETPEIPLPEAKVTSELPIPKPIDVIEEENCDRLPKHDEHGAVIEEIEAIPEAPTLPSLSINIPPPIFSNEIHETSILEPIVTAGLPTPKPIDVVEEERVLYHGHDAKIEEIVAIPEAPVLPPLSINIPTPIYIEETHEIPIPEAIITSELPIPKPIDVIEEENCDSLPKHYVHGVVIEEIEAIPEAPILPPLSINIPPPIFSNEIHETPIPKPIVTAELPTPKPIDVVGEERPLYDDYDAIIEEIVAIPEAPVLPPLSIYIPPPIYIEETHEIPIPEAIVTSELPIPKPIDVIEEENCDRLPKHDEHGAVIEEIEAIPEAPILPTLSINIPHPIFSNEIHETPILEPIVTAELPTPKPIDVVEEERPLYDDHDAMIEEIVAMPEAPVLPPLSINIPPPIYIEEIHEMLIPETIVTSELPIPKPIDVIEEENCDRLPKHDEQDAVIKEIIAIPEAPVLPPISTNIPPPIFTEVVHEIPIPEPIDLVEEDNYDTLPMQDEHDAVFQELVTIPEAPVLPPLSINVPPPFFTEENNEILLPDPIITSELPTPKPIDLIEEENWDRLPLHNEHEAVFEKIVSIPEAPVLPPLSINIAPPIFTEDINKIAIPELKPINVVEEEDCDRLPIHDEHDVVIEEIIGTPEAPLLPPLSVNVPPPIYTENISIIEPIQRAPKEVIAQDNFDRLLIHDEPKTIIKKLVTIPEAPVLPPLSVNVFSPIIKNKVNEVQIPEAIKLVEREDLDMSPLSIPLPTRKEESKPLIHVLEAVPEAPLLPPLSIDPPSAVVTEEVKIADPTDVVEAVEVTAKPILLDWSTAILPAMLDVPQRPIQATIERRFKKPLIIEGILQQKPYRKDIVILEKKITPTMVPQTHKRFNFMSNIAQPIQYYNSMPMFTKVNKFQEPGINQKLPILLRNNDKRISLVPLPRQSIVLKPKVEKKNRFVFSNSHARDNVVNRIMQNFMMRKQSPKLLKLVSLPTDI